MFSIAKQRRKQRKKEADEKNEEKKDARSGIRAWELSLSVRPPKRDRQRTPNRYSKRYLLSERVDHYTNRAFVWLFDGRGICGPNIYRTMRSWYRMEEPLHSTHTHTHNRARTTIRSCDVSILMKRTGRQTKGKALARSGV